jgi:hypothetical protein
MMMNEVQMITVTTAAATPTARGENLGKIGVAGECILPLSVGHEATG